MLKEPPDKLIYVIGEDQVLDLSGGRVIQDVNGGMYQEVRLNQFRSRYAHTNADFNKEGVYIVNIARIRLFSMKKLFQFTIQVVSSDEYIVSTNGPGDDFTYMDISPTYCENVTAVMISPPNNIIYPVGYTGEIDLSGIVVKAAQGWFPKNYDIADLDYTLKSDVDFNTPGNYIVKVYFTDDKGAERWFCFTVAVAEKVK